MQSVTKRRSIGRTSWLAWILLLFTAAMVGGMLWLGTVGCEIDEYVLTTLLTVTTGLGFGLLGALIVHFRPENRIGWICVAIGFLFTLQSITGAYAECGFAGIILLPTVPFIAWLNYWVTLFMALFLFVLLPLLFPNGCFLIPRWQRASLTLIALIGLIIIVSAFLTGPLMYNGMDSVYPIDNPLGLAFLPVTLGPTVDSLLTLTILASALLAIASLVIRWRRSTGDTRQQLNWFAYFLATAVVIQLVVFEMVGAFFYPEIFNTIWYRIIILVVFAGFPIVIGIAVFKYRLYDIDIIIRKTVVYGVLTILLALIYFGSVLLTQDMMTAVGGQQSPIVIVFSTLLIAALFSPLRRRTQAFIDQRFFRRKYDAEQTLAQFAASVRNEVDLDDLTAELLRVVQETMEPEHVSIHLRDQNSF